MTNYPLIRLIFALCFAGVFERLWPMTAPTEENRTMSERSRREVGRENGESVRGSAERRNTMPVVMSPESAPDKMPSPDRRTAKMPPTAELR